MKPAAFCILLMILIVSSSIGSVALGEEATAYTFTIKNDGESYICNSDSLTIKGDSLQAVFDSVAQSADDTVIMVFDQVSTTESVRINYSVPIVLSGDLNYSGYEGFIEIESGIMRVQGLVASSTSTLFTVDYQASLEVVSAVMTVESYAGVTAIANHGTVVIDSCTIVYETNESSFGGNAVYQNGYGSQLIIKGGHIIGPSAISVAAGTVSISDGMISASEKSDYNTANGYAICASNDAVLQISGGILDSVEREHTIFLKDSAVLKWNGGSIVGQTVLDVARGSLSGAIDLLGKHIPSISNGKLYVFNPEGECSPDTACLGVYPQIGYYWVKWTDEILEECPLVSSFTAQNITAVLSNIYNVQIQMADQQANYQLSFGSLVESFVDGLFVPNGYEIVRWVDQDYQTVETPYTVNDHVCISAVLGICDFDVVVGDDVVRPYDGSTSQIECSWTAVDGFLYNSYWTKEGDTSFSQRNLCVCSCADTGRYRLTVIASDGALSSASYSRWVNVDISKADYTGISHPSFTGTYSQKQTLKDFTLEEGYVWLNPDLIPSVDVTSYQASYCLDPVNYNEYFLEIEIILKKAIAIAEHGVLSGNYTYCESKTLAEYELEEHWAWCDPNIVPQAGRLSYSAIFNPDPINYTDYSCDIVVEIMKGHYTQVSPLSLSTRYRPGLTIKDVFIQYPSSMHDYSIPDSAEWDYTTSLLYIGTYTFDLTYNADPSNYYAAQTTLTIEVTKGVIEKTHPTVYVTYGEGLSTDDVLLEDGWRWKQRTLLSVGNQQVPALYNPDDNLYQDYETTVVVVVEHTVDPADWAHPDLSVAYSLGLTLADVSLNPGYRWNDPSVALNVGTYTYPATYYDQQADLHIAVWINVQVLAASYDMDGVMFDDRRVAFDGKAHTIVVDGTLPEGLTYHYVGESEYVGVGEYTLTIAFDSDDPNYMPVADMTATLTIERAYYDMSSFVWMDATVPYDGTPKHLREAGKLPEGVRIAEYVNNDGHIVVGNYVVGVRFEQDDEINYYPVGSMQAVLTIVKGNSPILGDTEQRFVYDGKSHKPNVLLGTAEQALSCDNNNAFVQVGVYTYRYWTESTINYNAGEKTITMYIIPAEQQAHGDVAGFVRDQNSGVEGEVTIRVSKENSRQGVVVLEVRLDGQKTVGQYEIHLSVPEWAAEEVEVLDEEGKRVASVIEGQSLVLMVDRLGDFTLVGASVPTHYVVPAWVKAVSALGGALIGVLVAIGYVCKYEKDKISAWLSKKRGNDHEK